MMLNLFVDLNKAKKKRKAGIEEFFFKYYYYFNALLTLENKNCRQEQKEKEMRNTLVYVSCLTKTLIIIRRDIYSLIKSTHTL
jgi:hypothetical protein